MSWLSRQLLNFVSPRYAKNWARHLVGALASALITAGYLDQALVDQWIQPAEQAVAGIILLLLTIAVSIGNTEKLKGSDVDKRS